MHNRLTGCVTVRIIVKATCWWRQLCGGEGSGDWNREQGASAKEQRAARSAEPAAEAESQDEDEGRRMMENGGRRRFNYPQSTSKQQRHWNLCTLYFRVVIFVLGIKTMPPGLYPNFWRSSALVASQPSHSHSRDDALFSRPPTSFPWAVCLGIAIFTSHCFCLPCN